MKFIDINERHPINGQQVLIKTNESWLPYCVCDYHNEKGKAIFDERVEGRLFWLEKEIGGWLSIEDIEKEPVHCKDCINRYDEYNCPLAEYKEAELYGDWDYWYAWGASEDDDFYCAAGCESYWHQKFNEIYCDECGYVLNFADKVYEGKLPEYCPECKRKMRDVNASSNL